ncbi:helix-turn-helix domain-containing protein [Yoonia sp. 2307UL14-13]|uniref:helix-turn-helix domain-containing protein n=1 Tax=Yoonia sp. 2307UL14-13 TaxID=3126506 RepID=UPI0030AD8D8C
MRRDLDAQNAIDDYHLITQGRGIFLQHHVPNAMEEPYHAHPSIEVNFLQDCDMDYSFGGRTISLQRDRFCIFWAAQPHRVLNVCGVGKITNAYVSLEEFWSWPLPKDFVDAIIAGGVAVGTKTLPDDALLAERFALEVDVNTDQMSRLHCLELQSRITRLALTGWELIAPPRPDTEAVRIGGNAIVHFEKILRFIATHYTEAITLGDVAKAAGVSENYANTLSKKIIGTTVKAHITNVRVFRARMLLAETDDKIISIALDSGFRSLSSFYDAFHRLVGTSPADFRLQVQQRS